MSAVFIWGSKRRTEPHGVTTEDFECPRCQYLGPLLVYVERKKTTVYFVPVTGWRDADGLAVCPACHHRLSMKKRKVRALPKITEGPELVRALQKVDHQVRVQFPTVPARPSRVDDKSKPA